MTEREVRALAEATRLPDLEAKVAKLEERVAQLEAQLASAGRADLDDRVRRIIREALAKVPV